MDGYLNFLLDIIKNEKIYKPILAIIIGYIIYKIIKTMLKRFIEKNKHSGYELKRRKTVVELLSNFIKIAITIVVILITLKAQGIDTTSIIASIGVASAVLGLAFQDTLKDVIGGITIILENYFIVGDIVRYKDFTGEVVSFGFKSTKIRNINNETLTLSNRNISEIINLSQAKAGVIINIPVAYEEDIDKVEKVIKIILDKINKLQDVETNSPMYLGINELCDSSVLYMVKFITNNDKQFQSKREALRIIKQELDKNGIKIPYNQIEVHNGKNI